MDFQSFVDWQAQKASRTGEIKISLDCLTLNQSIEAWVYDGNFAAGQFVTSVEEIDLESQQQRKEKADLKRLQEKYRWGWNERHQPPN